MREHGVLRRLLLVYEELERRIHGMMPVPENALRTGAGLVRRFVEDYHEKLEETFVFPRFASIDPFRDLVTVLRAQHEAGRRVTDDILALAASGARDGADVGARVSCDLRAYIRMYRPHAAREDTVMFPSLRAIVGDKEYSALGEAFEDEERARFGPRGFEDVVMQVARVEQALGIYDLATFTPAA
jgi:hemerythrin-like domain-containing protein